MKRTRKWAKRSVDGFKRGGFSFGLLWASMRIIIAAILADFGHPADPGDELARRK